jgi:transposase
MPQNFIEGRREQGFLLAPDVREWLPADHLAWFVIDAVAEMDLSAFYAAYRADGHGRAAYEPSLMVALVLCAFATRQRSSRAIERHCRQDVAYRVISGNLVPDHATIARFICRHARALSDLFGEVLRLCDRAGLVRRGVVSIDGTRIAGNASPEVNLTFDQIAREIVAEARATDEREDELYGEQRGDELPEQLRTPEGRRDFFRRARKRLGSNDATPRDRRPRRTRRCRSSSRRSGSLRAHKGARGSCGRASASSSRTAGAIRTRSRARAASAWCWRRSGSRASSTSSAAPTRPMSTIGRPRATGWVAGQAAGQSRIGRPSCPSCPPAT